MVLIVDEMDTSGVVVASMLRNILPEDDVRTFGIALAKEYLLGAGVFKNRKNPTVILIDVNVPVTRAREFAVWITEQKAFMELPLIAFVYPFPDANLEALKQMGIARTLILPREFKDAEAALGQALAPYLTSLKTPSEAPGSRRDAVTKQ